jgi:hypothetical protein
MTRKERISQFVHPPSGSFIHGVLSPEIYHSALILLSAARTADYGCGTIILAVTAFDVWLNELLLDPSLTPEQTRKQLDESTVSRYRFLHQHYQCSPPADTSDLEVVASVRNEIVHHFVRPDVTIFPDWYDALQTRGLLITHPKAPAVDYSVTQKLSSYPLAYWVFEVLEAAARRLIESAAKPQAQLHLLSFGLFAQYRQIRPSSPGSH